MNGKPILLVPLVVVLLSLAGCDDLSRIQVFTVSIVNDTGEAVVVRDCDDFCSSSSFALDLAPGASAPVNRTTNQHKYLSITTKEGAHVGCLDLYFTRAQPGAEIPVSATIPCPSGSDRPWKGIGLVLGALIAGLLILRKATSSRQ